MKASFLFIGNRVVRLLATCLYVFLIPSVPIIGEHQSLPIPTADSVSSDKNQDAVSYTDPTPLYISRMPVALQRANEIYGNTGDIHSILSKSSPSTSKPLADQHALIPPAFLLISSAFGLLTLLTIVTFAKNLRDHHHATCVVTSPESSLLR